MKKKRRGTAAQTNRHEAEARTSNAGPWEPPLPGMVKRHCPVCRYFFAAPTGSEEPRCPDCLDKAPRARPRLDAR
jgi:hypothetical protein